MKPSGGKVLVVKASRRDWIIGIVAGVLILGFIVFGILSMSRQVGNYGLTGVIVSKNFVPQPEEQITVGKGGLTEHKVDGTFTFEVQVAEEGNRIYTVWVDKSVYDSHQIGATFFFMRPPPARSPEKK